MSTAPEHLPVLWQLRFSHFNEKARWALDYKGVPHRRSSLPAPTRTAQSGRGEAATTPVLEIEGETIGDTTAIIAELERIQPDHRLYPAGPGARSRALALEEHFDVELGPYIRGAVFDAVLPYPEEMMEATVGHFGAATRLVSRAMYPLTRRILQKRLVEDIGGGELCPGERRSRASTASSPAPAPAMPRTRKSISFRRTWWFRSRCGQTANRSRSMRPRSPLQAPLRCTESGSHSRSLAIAPS